MSLVEQLESLKQDVVTTVTDNATVQQTVDVIEKEKAKIKACTDELIKRGKTTQAYKFMCTCLENLKLALYKLLGHCKATWARIAKWFSNINSKQLEMSI